MKMVPKDVMGRAFRVSPSHKSELLHEHKVELSRETSSMASRAWRPPAYLSHVEGVPGRFGRSLGQRWAMWAAPSLASLADQG